jgi:hypothetical protein
MTRAHSAFAYAALLAVAVLGASDVAEAARTPTQPYHVQGLQQIGASICDAGSWSYQIGWQPIVHEGRPWPKYFVGHPKCGAATYSCTASACTAKVSKCGTQYVAVGARVTADLGKAISGIDLGYIKKPPSCR